MQRTDWISYRFTILYVLWRFGFSFRPAYVCAPNEYYRMVNGFYSSIVDGMKEMRGDARREWSAQDE